MKGLIPAPLDFLTGFYNPWQTYQALPIKNPAIPDVVSQIIPWKFYTIENLKNGQWPLWNPFNFSGTPHLANFQSAVFYPLNFLFFIFDFLTAWSLFIYLQPLLASFFTFLFCRKLKISKAGSLFSSLAFAFCGFNTCWLEYGTLSHAFLWLPLALYLVEEIIEKRELFQYLMLSLVFSFSLLAGHLQITLYVILATLFYYIWRCWPVNIKKVLGIIFSLFLSLLLSSIQLLPTLEYYQQSIRASTIPIEWFKAFQIPFYYLVTFLAPDFFGNPVTRNLWSQGSYIEMMGYLGLVPFLMVLLYIFSAKKRKNSKFFLILAFVSLLFALPTPISNLLLWLKIPILSSSSPARAIGLTSFSLAVIAGFGIDCFLREIGSIGKLGTSGSLVFLGLWGFAIFSGNKVAQRNLILPSIIFLSFLIFVFIIPYIRKAFKSSKALILFTISYLLFTTLFDLFRFWYKFQPFSKKEQFYPNLPIINWLVENQGIYRSFGLFDGNLNLPFRVYSSEGYDSLTIQDYQKLLSAGRDGKVKIEGRSTGEKIEKGGKYAKKLLDILGVKYIFQGKSDVFAFPTWQYPESFKLIQEDKNYQVFENKDVLPRTFLVGDYEIISHDQKIIDRLFSEDFNPREKIILERKPPLNIEKEGKAHVFIKDYQPERVTMETNTDKNKLLFFSDSFYPGWQAFVDGKKEQIYKANLALRAIGVLSGSHEIVFAYQPKSFSFGGFLSLSGLVILFSGFLISFLKKNKFIPPDVYFRHKFVASFLKKGEEVLDVGGGLGQIKAFLPGIKVATADITGGDIVYDGKHLPLKENSFSTVVSIDTLEHVERKKRKLFVNELLRVAKKKVVLAAPLGTEKHLRLEGEIYQQFKKEKKEIPQYLKEHIKNGLPTLEEVKNLVPANLNVKIYFSGDIYFSQKLFTLQTLEFKNSILNKGFYFAKLVIYLLINTFLYKKLTNTSLTQETNRFYLVITRF